MINEDKSVAKYIKTTNITAVEKRLKKLKNHKNLPFAEKLPFILALMLNTQYKENIQKIYLFGSYAYGKPNEDSDIDFCVIIDDDISKYRREVSCDIRGKLWDEHIVPIDLLTYNEKVFYNFINSRGIENIIIEHGKLFYERN